MQMLCMSTSLTLWMCCSQLECRCKLSTYLQGTAPTPWCLLNATDTQLESDATFCSEFPPYAFAKVRHCYGMRATCSWCRNPQAVPYRAAPHLGVPACLLSQVFPLKDNPSKFP